MMLSVIMLVVRVVGFRRVVARIDRNLRRRKSIKF